MVRFNYVIKAQVNAKACLSTHLRAVALSACFIVAAAGEGHPTHPYAS